MKKKDKKCVSVIINDGKIEKFLQISNKKCESAAALLRKNGLDYHIGSAPVRNKVLDPERAKLENDGLKPSYWVKSQFLDRSIEYWLGNDGVTFKHIIFITIDCNFISVNKDEFSQCLFFERANKM